MNIYDITYVLKYNPFYRRYGIANIEETVTILSQKIKCKIRKLILEDGGIH